MVTWVFLPSPNPSHSATQEYPPKKIHIETSKLLLQINKHSYPFLSSRAPERGKVIDSDLTTHDMKRKAVDDLVAAAPNDAVTASITYPKSRARAVSAASGLRNTIIQTDTTHSSAPALARCDISGHPPSFRDLRSETEIAARPDQAFLNAWRIQVLQPSNPYFNGCLNFSLNPFKTAYTHQFLVSMKL